MCYYCWTSGYSRDIHCVARVPPASEGFLQVQGGGQGETVLQLPRHKLKPQGQALHTEPQRTLGYWQAQDVKDRCEHTKQVKKKHTKHIKVSKEEELNSSPGGNCLPGWRIKVFSLQIKRAAPKPDLTRTQALAELYSNHTQTVPEPNL